MTHPHASPLKRAVAEEGTILRVQVGSGVHGTAISGQDDRDEMGVCLEPARYVTGIAKPFDQYEYHTAWERPGGIRERSGAGDLDVVIYGARKWARLAASGNPTVLLPLFVPASEVVSIAPAGEELRAEAGRFVSRVAAGRFLGYLRAQRRAMTGESGAHTNRPELVEVYGYDVKFAMHALRLGVQGVELLTTGRITLPIPEPYLAESARGAPRRAAAGRGARPDRRAGCGAGDVADDVAAARRAGPPVDRRLAAPVVHGVLGRLTAVPTGRRATRPGWCTFPVIHGEVTWTEERWDVYLPGVPGALLTGFWLTLRARGPADPSSRRRPTRAPRRRRPAHRH